MKNVILALLALSLSACASTAGPFVTSVSSDGDDGLIVEKCMVKMDPWMSTVSNTECTTVPIKMRTSRKPSSK
jgi:type IV secretion system protein VirB7